MLVFGEQFPSIPMISHGFSQESRDNGSDALLVLDTVRIHLQLGVNFS